MPIINNYAFFKWDSSGYLIAGERKSLVRFCSNCPVIMCVKENDILSGWYVRSEVGSGLLYWCNSADVPQIGAVVFAPLFCAPKPAPIKVLPSSNKMSYIWGVQ